MARTYWAPKGQDWEFLGAFADGHKVKDRRQPQGHGYIIDLQGMTVQQVNEALRVEDLPSPPRLVGLPTAVTRRLQARMPVSLPWAQIQGFAK